MQEHHHPTAVLVDNRREHHLPFPLGYQQLIQKFNITREFIGPEQLVALTPQDLHDAQVVIGAFGDGSLGHLLSLEPQRPIILLNLGTANTTYQGLAGLAESPQPEFLRSLSQKHRLKAYQYHPLHLESASQSWQQAYLGGFSHLTIKTTRNKENLQAHPRLTPWVKSNIGLTYSLAGLASAFTLHHRIQPRDICFTTPDEQPHQINPGQLIAACAVNTIPILGTFKFQPSSPDQQLSLLTLTADRTVELYSKYALTLMIGGLLKNGPDLCRQIGLIDVRPIDNVNLLPDPQAADSGHSNVCLDGQLLTHRNPITLSLSDSPVTILRPSDP